ncbi:MAG TPA: NUDIX domain-containing protein [Dissulfurispiraceae bacterium]|nr:NUDIX domain-containing protein [Dissulfurispiraceae bacterium]
MEDEILEIVDRQGRKIGQAPRSVIHSDPKLIHRVVHVFVFHSDGRLLLQKRSLNKDLYPGRWDTSVGGHISPGEDAMTAALREMREELGISCDSLPLLSSHLFEGLLETELVFAYSCMHDGPFSWNTEEIDEVRYWSMKEIGNTLDKDIFTPNFEVSYARYLSRTKSSDTTNH